MIKIKKITIIQLLLHFNLLNGYVIIKLSDLTELQRQLDDAKKDLEDLLNSI